MFNKGAEVEMVSYVAGQRIVLYIERIELERKMVCSPESLCEEIERIAGMRFEDTEIFVGESEILLFAKEKTDG